MGSAGRQGHGRGPGRGRRVRARRRPVRVGQLRAGGGGPRRGPPRCPASTARPLVYNNADPYLPDLVVCRPELARSVLAAVRRGLTGAVATTVARRGPSPGARPYTPPTWPQPPPTPAADAPPDLAIGAFSDDPPWLVDPDRMSWRRRRRRRPLDHPPPAPGAHPPPSPPPGPPGLHRPVAPGPRGRPVAAAGAGHAGEPSRAVPPAAEGRRAPRPDLHQARPDHLLRRGPVPRRAGRRSSRSAATRCPPSPSARCGPPSRPTSARPSRTSSPSFDRTPLAAASIAQVHAATLRTGEQVVVKVQRTDRRRAWSPRTSRSMAWLAPFLVGRLPVRRARQPAGARRAVRRDHHRGARLPARGPEHARRGPQLRRARPAAATSSPGPTPTSSPAGCW